MLQPVGKFSPTAGALACSTCPNSQTYTTRGEGAASASECNVPVTTLPQEYPERQPVSVEWELFGYTIDQNQQQMQLRMSLVHKWEDDRITT